LIYLQEQHYFRIDKSFFNYWPVQL